MPFRPILPYFLCVLAAFSAVSVSAPAQEAEPADDGATFEKTPLHPTWWARVAKAHAVVTGVLVAPVEKIETAQKSGRHDYVELKLADAKVLKGNVDPEGFTVKYYTRKVMYTIWPEKVIALHGKRVAVFAVQAGRKADWFLQHGQPVVAVTAPDEIDLSREAALQASVSKHWKRFLEIDQDETYEKVAALIEATQKKETASAAYKTLVAMGRDAVPAMIALIDDRRDLIVKGISFKAPAGHWEGVTHYGPKKVVDLLDAILNHTVGFGGSCVNGETDAVRDRAVAAWRVYLYQRQCKAREKKKDE